MKENKRKNIWLKLIIIIAIILVILGIGIFCYFKFFLNNTHTYKNYPIVYGDNDQLKAWYNGKYYIVDEKFGAGDDLDVTYANNNPSLFVYENDGDVIIYDIKKEQKQKIASSGLYGATFTKDDRYLLFKDMDYNLFVFDLKTGNKDKITNKYTRIITTHVYDDYFYYLEEESEESSTYKLYMYNITKKENRRIDTSVDQIISNKDPNFIYYSKVNNGIYDIYKYDTKLDKKDKLVDNITSLYADDDSNLDRFIYTKVSSTKLDILDDDISSSRYADTVNKYCDDGELSQTDCVALEEYNSSNEIIINAAENLQLYNIYYFKDGKATLIASDVVNVFGGNNEIVVYSKYNSTDKAKLSTLFSVKDFNDYINEHSTVYYIKNGQSEVTISYDKNSLIPSYAVIDKDIYLVTDSNELLYVDLSKNNGQAVYVDDGKTGFGAFLFTNGKLLYLSNYNESKESYSLKIAKGKDVKELDSNVKYLYKINDEIYYLSNWNDENECDYNIYENGKQIKLASTVYYLIKIGNNKYYVIKNHSKDNNTSDIYIYDGKEFKSIAYDIKERQNSIYDIVQ